MSASRSSLASPAARDLARAVLSEVQAAIARSKAEAGTAAEADEFDLLRDVLRGYEHDLLRLLGE